MISGNAMAAKLQKILSAEDGGTQGPALARYDAEKAASIAEETRLRGNLAPDMLSTLLGLNEAE